MSAESEDKGDTTKILATFKNRCMSLYANVLSDISALSPPEILYHYTNDKGLYGIFESGELWMNDIYGLNDPTEIGHVVNIALEELGRQVDNSKEIFDLLKNDIAAFHGAGFFQNEACTFVASLTTKADDLNQWRAYADNGKGYSVGFDRDVLSSVFKEVYQKQVMPAPFAVSYENEVALGYIIRLMQAAEECVVNILSLLDAGSTEFRKALTEVSTGMIALIYLVSSIFKNSNYKDECEYRFVQQYLKPIEEVGASTRIQPYKLIRYIRIPWKAVGFNAVKKIITGPSGGSASEKFANDVKRHFGLRDVEVIPSRIPYRS